MCQTNVGYLLCYAYQYAYQFSERYQNRGNPTMDNIVTSYDYKIVSEPLKYIVLRLMPHNSFITTLKPVKKKFKLQFCVYEIVKHIYLPESSPDLPQINHILVKTTKFNPRKTFFYRSCLFNKLYCAVMYYFCFET